MHRIAWSSIAVVILCVWASDPTSAQENAPRGSLELRLVAHRIAYRLDLGGKTEEEFRRALIERQKQHPSGLIPASLVDQLPRASELDLSVEILNTSDQPIDLWIGGDFGAEPRLDVRGPGVFPVKLAQPVGGRLPEKALTRAAKVTLKPGASHLQTVNLQPPAERLYLTALGEFTLTAVWSLAAAADKAGGPVLTSAPTTIRVIDALPDAARIKGMRSALADIEQGTRKLKMVPPPAPPWWDAYLELLRQECGVEVVFVDVADGAAWRESEGYNAIILMEIEHLYGTDVLTRLARKAEELDARKRRRP